MDTDQVSSRQVIPNGENFILENENIKPGNDVQDRRSVICQI